MRYEFGEVGMVNHLENTQILLVVNLKLEEEQSRSILGPQSILRRIEVFGEKVIVKDKDGLVVETGTYYENTDSISVFDSRAGYQTNKHSLHP